MNDWRIISSDPPDWKEGGWNEIRRKDGTQFVGWIDFDVLTGGDDEIPIPEVDMPDGRKASLFEFEAYLKISETKKPAG